MDENAALGLLGAGMVVYFLICLVITIVMVIAWWKIVSKAGYSGAWSLVMFVPLLNIIMFLVFAFSQWPVLQKGSSAAPGQGVGRPQ